jgi:hypothetical protein
LDHRNQHNHIRSDRHETVSRLQKSSKSIRKLAMDRFDSKQLGKPHELFVAFSVYKNGAKLFDTKRKESRNVLRCLPGLRTFAMIHIMYGHRYIGRAPIIFWLFREKSRRLRKNSLFIAFLIKNIKKKVRKSRSLLPKYSKMGALYIGLLWMPKFNSRIVDPDGKFVKTFVSVFATVYHIPVDTFLVIGGLLLTVSILKSIEKFV